MPIRYFQPARIPGQVMLLVIPSIELRKDYCVREKEGSFERESVFFDDPVKMARLWRLQNARSLHIEGHDTGNRCRRNVLRDLCSSVDIPVQLRGGMTSLKHVRSAFDAGIYRVVIEVYDERSRKLFQAAAELYSCSRVIAGIHTTSDAHAETGTTVNMSVAIDIVKSPELSGCRRFMYSDESFDGSAGDRPTARIREFCRPIRMAHVTVTDCISGFDDLMTIAGLVEFGVDSAIIGRQLYENCFPCQQSWCWNHKEELDLSRVSTAQLQKH